MSGGFDARDRPGMVDALHKLYQELEGPENVKKFVLGADPAAPPEPEPSTERNWVPTVQPRGLTFDDAKLNDLDVLGRTLGFTPAERQAWSHELARSTHRESLPESVRLAETQRVLEQHWGPKLGAIFQRQMDRVRQEQEHLGADQLDDLERSGAMLDAWPYLVFAEAWTKRHPQP